MRLVPIVYVGMAQESCSWKKAPQLGVPLDINLFSASQFENSRTPLEDPQIE